MYRLSSHQPFTNQVTLRKEEYENCCCWLYLGLAPLNSQGHMAVGDAHVFPGFLTPVLKQLSFQSHRLLFLTCFCRGERQKYTRKKVPLNLGSNSRPPVHEPDMLTTELLGRGRSMKIL